MNLTNLDEIKSYPIRENPDILNILLKDRTTNKNIMWATDSYKDMGKGYYPEDHISSELLRYKGRDIVKPRIYKTHEDRIVRTRKKGEVFTPSWVIKKKIDLIEEELSDLELEEYICKRWLEITCGEAPYMTNRYDAVTGEYIKIEDRVGFLDRKLKRISEEIGDKKQWLYLVQKAYQASYGYEYQGDSLLIARENLLDSFIDYYVDKFFEIPKIGEIESIAKIISYNVFQMDGLKYTLPVLEKTRLGKSPTQLSFFKENIEDTRQLEIILDKGEDVKVKNWSKNMVKFKDIIQIQGGMDDMKFDVIIGNPPYQDNTKQQIYTDFYLQSLKISRDNVCLIFPTGWQKPTNANNLKKLNNESIKRDRQIVSINNVKGIFKGVPGAEWTNIIIWKKGYDNGLKGKQNIMINGKEKKVEFLPIKKEDIEKPYHIKKLNEMVLNTKGFETIDSCISTRKPYGLSTNFLKKYKELDLGQVKMKRELENDIAILTKDGLIYVNEEFKFPRNGESFKFYKVFIPYAWGNWDKKSGLGGAFSDIIVAQPNVACLETYLEAGKFENEDLAYKFAKYLMTNFARALLYVNKYSHHSTTAFKSIPKQTFEEPWWDLTIEEINHELFSKYRIPYETKKYVDENIQKRTESNIINVKEME